MLSRRMFMTLCAIMSTHNAVRTRRLGIHVTGTLSATDVEAQEGYFALGKELAIVTHPKAPVIDELRAMVGQTVQCSIFVP